MIDQLTRRHKCECCGVLFNCDTCADAMRKTNRGTNRTSVTLYAPKHRRRLYCSMCSKRINIKEKVLPVK